MLRHCVVCCQGSNELNKELLDRINADGRIYMVPAECKAVYFLRFAVCATRTEAEDIEFAWNVIVELTDRLLHSSHQ